MRRSVLVLVVGFCCLLGVVGAVSTPVAGAAGDVGIENALSESASDDRIDVETRVSVPESTTELEITLPEGSDVTDLDGFERVDTRTYEWTGTTAEPSVGYEYEGTVRGTRGDREGVRFVVADGWALVRTPSVGVSWRTTDEDSEVVRRNTVTGEGIASTHMAYLGPYAEHTGAAAGQTFRLVVPAAADLRADPEDVIARLESAAERLSIGDPTESVFVVAAPTAEHTWVSAGVQRGDGGDMWVRDAEAIGTNRDTWVHEYVHTRQRYEPAPETRWTIEGMADYYAALLSYEAGAIGYDGFADKLEAGADAEYDGVRLADPGTWAGTDADYDRGALVFAHLDRRLRAVGTTLDAVLAGVNGPEAALTQRAFLGEIERAGGEEIREEAERYAETTEAPPIPTRSEHVAAFGGPDVRYSIEGTTVSGPYRNRTAGDAPRLVVGETLTATLGVENLGSDAGPFDAAFRVEDRTVASESGRLAPGETASLSLGHAFETPGSFDVSIGGERRSVTVERPAGVRVTAIEADPESAAVGESIAVRATVVSTADRPGAGDVAFAVDGEPVANRSVRVGEEPITVETTVSFDERGRYAVSAGDRSTTVAVGESAETGGDGSVGIEDQPGGGVGVALAALAAFALLAARR
ncbi:hypothetical protein [Natronomonas sp.]|uniref:hypothetical protein n=1 Tax=Natronomonas sp. TaxID=2184060 RepID=UPI00261778ED|nr:hypothetical protein [Natronomonas sp.]